MGKRRSTDSVGAGNERDEADGFAKGDHGLTVEHADELQLLGVGGADGDDHASAIAELRE